MSTKRPTIPDLEPRHLSESMPLSEEAARTSVMEATTAPVDDRKLRMRAKEYTFNFRHVAPNGRTYEGVFTSRVPGIRQKAAIGVMRGQLAGGIAYNVLDPASVELNLVLATLAFCLDEKRPDWAKDLMTLEDTDVLFKLFEEVAIHEATFLGRG